MLRGSGCPSATGRWPYGPCVRRADRQRRCGHWRDFPARSRGQDRQSGDAGRRVRAQRMDFAALGPELIALGQVIMIDLVLAGDNAIVVGMAAAGLPKEQRGKVILVGIIAATILRILFALITT